MDATLLAALLLALLSAYVLIVKPRRTPEGRLRLRLPPGSLGIPFIGQSLGLLRAMKANTGDRWLEDRVNKYGTVSKLTLFGRPTVFLTGQAANKFIFANESNGITLQQPRSMCRILGERNMTELTGEDYRRVRAGVGAFLKPDMLKKYVCKMDFEAQQHLEKYWIGKHQVTVLPLMKKLTFNIISSILFGLERGTLREELMKDFGDLIPGVWSIPLNLPFTQFHKSMKASERAHNKIMEITHDKRRAAAAAAALDYQHESRGDLITYLLTLGGADDEAKRLSEEEIVDTCVVVMLAGYDTSSILITFLIQHLAKDPTTYEAVLREQEEIAKSKVHGEALTWEDITKMKYTWRVALEQLRLIPPVFGNFRRVLEDLEFGGYLIPKGWQVFWVASMTHMNPDIFPEPEKFDPGRFTSASSIPPYSFLGFGAGTRSCPGNEFARIETLVALHYIVTKFKWKLLCKEEDINRIPMPTPSHGLPIQIEMKK